MLLPGFLLIAGYYEIVPADVQNEVHEWGVVVFINNGSPVCGGTWKNTELYPNYEPPETEAHAPVVWIHGEPFSEATFAVSTGEQAITFTYPVPDRSATGVAEWDIASAEATLDNPLENHYEGPFRWAIEYWRDVPSLPLYQASAALTEGFLYYECEVNQGFADHFFSWSEDGNPLFAGDEVREALFFTPAGAIAVEIKQGEFIPYTFDLGGLLDPEIAPNTFLRWINTRLKPSEITALWETWEPVFCEEDSYWLVFPVPRDYYNEVSNISLDFTEIRVVQYERFFLGAVKLSFSE